MKKSYENFDYKRLRYDLEVYFGTAMNNGYKQAVIDLVEVQTTTDYGLLQIAQNYGFDLSEYSTSGDDDTDFED